MNGKGRGAVTGGGGRGRGDIESNSAVRTAWRPRLANVRAAATCASGGRVARPARLMDAGRARLVHEKSQKIRSAAAVLLGEGVVVEQRRPQPQVGVVEVGV
jgi:hypothetical protein